MDRWQSAPGLGPGAPFAREPSPRREAGKAVDRFERRYESAARLGALVRRSALGVAGFVLVAVVAGAGWVLSYDNLHRFAVAQMGFGVELAWLVPVVFDGAPLGLSMVIYQARLHARSALVWRGLMWAFVGLSAFVNWQHTPGVQHADQLAAILPVAAAVLFEGLMGETHKRAERDLYDSAVVPRLTLVCWLLDRRRTFRAFKVKQLRPLAAAEAALEIDSPLPDPRAEPIRLPDVDLSALGVALSTAGSGADREGNAAADSALTEGRTTSVPARRTGQDHGSGASGGDVRTRVPGAGTDTGADSAASGARPKKRTSGRTTGGTRRPGRRAEPDVSDLIPVGQQAYADLHEAGVHITRDRLAREVRQRNGSLSAARAHALWRALHNGHAPAL